MIYFIGDWSIEDEDLKLNGAFNLINIFDHGEVEYNIIIPSFLPFLRYAWNGYQYLDESRIMQMADYLQSYKTSTDIPMAVNDLNLPANVEKIYGNSGILLMKDGQGYGKVYFNKYGFVREVQFFLSDGQKKINYYSDHGFVYRSKTLSNTGTIIEECFYSDQGQPLLNIQANQVKVSGHLANIFEQQSYQNMDGIYREFLQQSLADFNPVDDQIVIDAGNMQIIKMFKQLDMSVNIVFLLSDQEADRLNVKDKIELLSLGHVVVESQYAKEELDALHEGNTHVIPMFPTKIDFGVSNTIANQEIFWQLGQFDEGVINEVLADCLTQLEMTLTIETHKSADVTQVERLVDRYIAETFAVNFDELVENSEIDFQPKELVKRIGMAKAFKSRIKVQHDLTEHERLAIIGQARLYVDFSEQPNNYIHAAVVSAGVPLISKRNSQYLIDGQNGMLFHETSDLLNMFSYYLEHDRNWNRALVESVSVIETNNIEQLSGEWRKLLYEISK